MGAFQHRYGNIHLTWTGNLGEGTRTYRSYTRDYEVTVPGKHPIIGSADKTFHGDRKRWNPEELLVTALAECHMLTYFHLATQAGIVVTAYEDDPTGVLAMDTDGVGGAFESVTLHPRVTVAPGEAPESTAALARQLHSRVPQYCFIARSMNFPVLHEPTIAVAER